jgi:hypothetical protein
MMKSIAAGQRTLVKASFIGADASAAPELYNCVVPVGTRIFGVKSAGSTITFPETYVDIDRGCINYLFAASPDAPLHEIMAQFEQMKEDSALADCLRNATYFSGSDMLGSGLSIMGIRAPYAPEGLHDDVNALETMGRKIRATLLEDGLLRHDTVGFVWRDRIFYADNELRVKRLHRKSVTATQPALFESQPTDQSNAAGS